MVEIESARELLAQQVPPQGAYWLGMFFLTGLIVGLAVTFIIAGLWSRDKRHIEKEAAAAGVSLNLENKSRIDSAQGIEGCVYCIGFIIIIAAGAIGISLPVILPEAAENLIVMIIMILFGSVFWALALASIPYVRSYRREFRKILQNAIDNKSESQ